MKFWNKPILLGLIMASTIATTVLCHADNRNTEKYNILLALAVTYDVYSADEFDRHVEQNRAALGEKFKSCIRRVMQRLPRNPSNGMPGYGNDYAETNIANSPFDSQRLWLHMMEDVANGKKYRNTALYQQKKQAEKLKIAVAYLHPLGAQLLREQERMKRQNMKLAMKTSNLICYF